MEPTHVGCYFLDGPLTLPLARGVASAILLLVPAMALALDVHIQPGDSIQTAIDQVAIAGGGSVYLAAGTYTPASSVRIKSNVRLVGAGQGMTVISYGGGSDVITQNSEGLANITVEALTVMGTNGDDCIGIFIAALGTYHTNINIINCEATSCGMGVHIKRAYGVTVSGCNFHGNGSIGKEAFYHNLYIRQCDGTQNVNVVNCLLNDSTTGNGLNLSFNNNVFVSGCTATSNYFRGMRAASTDGFSVQTSICSGNGDRGLIANSEGGISTKNIDWQTCVANSNLNNGIEARPGVTGLITGSYATSNTPADYNILAGGVTTSGNSTSLFSVPPPAAPTGLTAAVGSPGIDLSWTLSVGAIYYNVKYAATIGGPYTSIARGLTNTTYTSAGLPPAANHYFVVSAWAMGGESVDSIPASTVNPTPTNITLTVNGTLMTLQWPSSHTGWLLQSNSVGLSYPDNWFPVPGSVATNMVNVPVDITQPHVFYRLTY